MLSVMQKLKGKYLLPYLPVFDHIVLTDGTAVSCHSISVMSVVILTTLPSYANVEAYLYVRVCTFMYTSTIIRSNVFTG